MVYDDAGVGRWGSELVKRDTLVNGRGPPGDNASEI